MNCCNAAYYYYVCILWEQHYTYLMFHTMLLPMKGLLIT